MTLDFLYDEKQRHLLSRHFVITGLNGEREIVRDIVSYVLSLEHNPWSAFRLFERAVGFSSDVIRLQGYTETYLLERFGNHHEWMAPHQESKYFIRDSKVFYYSTYWCITLLDGGNASALRDALRWYMEMHFPVRRKKSHLRGQRGRRYVSGGYRQLNTVNEKRQAVAHCQEYGEAMVRPSRRADALPSNWDDLYWAQQRCWKSQRKTRKQWQR